MFSGHTAMLTILNRFVVTYTPESWHLLHNMCAALNGAGMFFILAAHEHYTLDVLMGFYIATRTFQSYHTVANTAHTAANTSHAARSRTKKWFPMVSFLEEGTHGPLPNEYQVPSAVKAAAVLHQVLQRAMPCVHAVTRVKSAAVSDCVHEQMRVCASRAAARHASVHAVSHAHDCCCALRCMMRWPGRCPSQPINTVLRVRACC